MYHHGTSRKNLIRSMILISRAKTMLLRKNWSTSHREGRNLWLCWSWKHLWQGVFVARVCDSAWIVYIFRIVIIIFVHVICFNLWTFGTYEYKVVVLGSWFAKMKKSSKMLDKWGIIKKLHMYMKSYTHTHLLEIDREDKATSLCSKDSWS